jgi:hypothetical protein
MRDEMRDEAILQGINSHASAPGNSTTPLLIV